MSKKLAEAVVDYINSNKYIANILGSKGIELLYTTDISRTFIVYEIKPIIGGIVKQSQLQLKVISKDAEITLELEEILDSILDFGIQTPTKLLKHDISFRSEKAGGGLLFMDELKTYENTLIYVIKWRCR